MAKKKNLKPGDRNYRGKRERSRPVAPEEINGWADKLSALADRLRSVSRNMRAAGIESIQPITAGLRTAIDTADEKIDSQFEDKLRKAIKRKARAAHDRL
jgi:hypothetical protein